MIISLGILLTGALTFGAISSSAIDPLTSELNRIKTNTEINNKTETSVLVHVGQREITTTDVLNYRNIIVYPNQQPTLLTLTFLNI